MPWQALETHIEVFEEHFKQANFHALPPEVQMVAFQYWGLMQETLTAQLAQAGEAQVDQQADMIEDVTYAEEHAKHQAEVDVKGKPVMNNPAKKTKEKK
jgi:hypothetical protein